jgi:ribosomal protein L7/L12
MNTRILAIATTILATVLMTTAIGTNANGSAASVSFGKDQTKKHYVVLEELGDNKIYVIKIVREWTGLGLAAAKDLVEDAPCIIKKGLSRGDADKLKDQLEANPPEGKKTRAWVGPSVVPKK